MHLQDPGSVSIEYPVDCPREAVADNSLRRHVLRSYVGGRDTDCHIEDSPTFCGRRRH